MIAHSDKTQNIELMETMKDMAREISRLATPGKQYNLPHLFTAEL